MTWVFSLFLLIQLNNDRVSAHSNISRHLLLEDLSMVVLMADAVQTPGPFAEQDNDYVTDTNDLRLAGTDGSPGIAGGDRLSVTNGTPLTLAIRVYDVSDPSFGGVELPNVEVFLWHTDAVGIYSAVGEGRQELENTAGQIWCRGIQSTNSEGVATFETILPGWYPGRAIHYHVRLRFPGETQFAATSQFYVGDADLAQYQSEPPYSQNPYPITPRNRDGIFARLNNPIIQEMLTLTLDGSVESGFSSTMNVGVVPPEGFTLMPTTTAPTIVAKTANPTSMPTQQPEPVPRPVPEPVPIADDPVAALSPPPVTTAPPATETEEPVPVLPDSTTLTESNAASGTKSPLDYWMATWTASVVALWVTVGRECV